MPLLQLKKHLLLLCMQPGTELQETKRRSIPIPDLLNSKTELLLQMSSSGGRCLFDAGSDVENFCQPLVPLSLPAGSSSPPEPAEAPASSRGFRRPPSLVERGLEGVGLERRTPDPSRRGCCGAGVPAGGARRKACARSTRVHTQSRAYAVDEESFQCRHGDWLFILVTIALWLELASISTRFGTARQGKDVLLYPKTQKCPAVLRVLFLVCDGTQAIFHLLNTCGAIFCWHVGMLDVGLR